METTFFGLIETKSFNFLRIIINGGQGGGSSGPPEPPLDPPLLYWCLVGATLLSYVVLKYWICTGQDNTYYSWFK